MNFYKSTFHHKNEKIDKIFQQNDFYANFNIESLNQICNQMITNFEEKNFEDLFECFDIASNYLEYYIIRLTQNDISSISSIFVKLQFDIFIHKILENICNDINLLDHLLKFIFLATQIDLNFFRNIFILPCLLSLYKSIPNNTLVLDILTQIIPQQIIFDQNYVVFFPIYSEILLTVDTHYKINLIYSFILIKPPLLQYYHFLLNQMLTVYYMRKYIICYKNVFILYKILKCKIDLLYESGVYQVLNDIFTFNTNDDELVREILKLCIIILKSNKTIVDQNEFIFDNSILLDHAINAIDSENEGNSIVAMNFFINGPKKFIHILLSSIDIDLLVSIIYDGITESNFLMRKTSFNFLKKIMEYPNNKFLECLSLSNIFNIGHSVFDFNDQQLITQFLNILEVILHESYQRLTLEGNSKYIKYLMNTYFSSNFDSELQNINDIYHLDKIPVLLSAFESLNTNHFYE